MNAQKTVVIDAAQKHIILLKLDELLENVPKYDRDSYVGGKSALRQWLAIAGALLKRYDPFGLGLKFDNDMSRLRNHPGTLFDIVQGLVVDAIERLKLDLELEGRSEIGMAYAPGEVYQYFAELKRIVAGAKQAIFVVEPYFDGKAFDSYLAGTPVGISIRVIAERYANEVAEYAAKHAAQYRTQIEIRKSKELHDRLVIIDGDDCWISGGSIKDGARRQLT